MRSGNEATIVNPFVVNDRTVDIHITRHGSDWYWAVMSVMGTTMLVIIGLSFLKPRTSRIFHYILATVALIAMIEHYSMAANLGWVPIDVEWRRPTNPLVAGVNRQIWWVRYCGWFLVWPLLSLAILLTAAMPTAYVIWTCFLSSVMAVMALVGAMVRSDYKWGYYGFWIACWFAVGYYLFWTPRRYAVALGIDVRSAHRFTTAWVWFLWMCYPVCWGLSEGGNVIAPDSEFIFYGILDCFLIPFFSALFLWSHHNIEPARLGVSMRDYDGLLLSQTNGIYYQKDRKADTGAPTAATNGSTGFATSAGNPTTDVADQAQTPVEIETPGPGDTSRPQDLGFDDFATYTVTVSHPGYGCAERVQRGFGKWPPHQLACSLALNAPSSLMGPIPSLLRIQGTVVRNVALSLSIPSPHSPLRRMGKGMMSPTRSSSEYSIRKVGRPNTPEFRIYIEKDSIPISSWHDVPLYANDERTVLNMIVEIPRWENVKFEVSRDEVLNPIKQDVKNGRLRFVRNRFPHKGYIWNYGALPCTWEDPSNVLSETHTNGDNDPLDACEIGEQVAYSGQIKQVKVLGAMCLLDEGETDWKIIVIDVNDPSAPELNDIDDVETYQPGLLSATTGWFRFYKMPDGKPENQVAFSGQFKKKEYATKIVRECSEAWQKLVTSESQPEGISLANVNNANSPYGVDPKGLKIPKADNLPPTPIQQNVDKWFYIPAAVL